MQYGAFEDGRYDHLLFPFMRKKAQDTYDKTEAAVVSPPALWITADDGSTFTLGFDGGGERTGEYEFDVVRNGRKTGEFACRIEMRGGKVRIFGSAGWRVWNGKEFI